MPYFNNGCNILFIHIPKTGGTSVEKYLSNKYKVALDANNLYTCGSYDNNVSLQHQSLNYLLQNAEQFHINIINMTIITIVRNPYHRIISELFYSNIINMTMKPDTIYWILRKQLYEYKFDNNIYDNHYMPQHYFIVDINGNIPPNIIIFKTECLTESMKQYGFTDFNSHHNKCNLHNTDYMTLLNNKSIKLINSVYKKDFEMFNYSMLE